MLTFIPLNNVLNYIPQAIRNEGDDLTLMSNALQFYRNFDLPQVYEKKFAILEVVDHKVKLPSDVKNIAVATHFTTNPKEEDCKDLMECSSSDTTEATLSDCLGCSVEPLYGEASSDQTVARHTIAYGLFIDSAFYNNSFTPLKYKGLRSGVCKWCYSFDGCEHWFSVDSNNILWTSFQEGWICLDYDAVPTNDDNDILVLNDVKVMQAIAMWAEAMHWRNRSAMKEEGAMRMYADAIARANNMFQHAKGQILLKNIDTDLAKRFSLGFHNSADILRAPQAFYRNYDYPRYGRV